MHQNVEDLDDVLSELSNVFGIRKPSNPEVPTKALFTPPIQNNSKMWKEKMNKNFSCSMDDLLVPPPPPDDEFLYFQPSYVNVEQPPPPPPSTSYVSELNKGISSFPHLHELPEPPPSLIQPNIEAQFADTDSLYLTMALGKSVQTSLPTSNTRVPGKIEPQILKAFQDFQMIAPLPGPNDYEEVEKDDYVLPDFIPSKSNSDFQNTLLASALRSSFKSRGSSTSVSMAHERKDVTSSQTLKAHKASGSMDSEISLFLASKSVARMAIELPIPPHPHVKSSEFFPPVNDSSHKTLRVGHNSIAPRDYQGSSISFGSHESLISNNLSPSGSRYRETILTQAEKAQFLLQESRRMSEESNSKKVILNVFNTDESYKTIVVDYKAPARDVIEQLLLKNNFSHSITWQLFEVLTDEKLEREIEDHELVAQIYESWGTPSNNRLKFQQNFKKYEIFQDPSLYIPGFIEKRSPTQRKQSTVEHAKGRLMQEMLMTTDRMTELTGHLYIKERKKKWRRVYCSLRKSGLYYSTKGPLRDPRHWYQLVNFTDSNFYLCKDDVKRKKVYQAPLPELIVFVKNSATPEPPKDRVCICCLDRSNRICWQQGIRLSKHGVDEIRQNYQIATSRHQKLKQLHSDNEYSTLARNKESKKSQTADSTGQENWFRGDLSSKAAEDLLLVNAPISGMFLVRSFDGKLYLSLMNGSKIYHVEIQRVIVNGNWLLTVNNGLMNFHSLNELIDYHRKEKGSLPVKLNQSVKE